MGTIRSIEEIIRQDEEKKAQEKLDKGIHQTFNAEVGNVINAEPGSTINIDQRKRD